MMKDMMIDTRMEEKKRRGIQGLPKKKPQANKKHPSSRRAHSS
jgi:hypothetical protein